VSVTRAAGSSLPDVPSRQFQLRLSKEEGIMLDLSAKAVEMQMPEVYFRH
jgi:hypothetical protein